MNKYQTSSDLVVKEFERAKDSLIESARHPDDGKPALTLKRETKRGHKRRHNRAKKRIGRAIKALGL